MEDKKAFVVYTNWKQYIDELTDEEVGMWTRWMFDYCNDKWDNKEIEYPRNTAVKVLCKLTKDILKKDLAKYKDKKKRIDAINERKRSERDTKSTQSHNDIAHEINNDIDNELEHSNKLLVISNKNISKDICKESVKEKPTSRFNPPTLEDIKIYCLERNNLVDCERFYDFYSSKGWMVGKNKMKDWKACVRTWEKEAGFKNPNEATPQTNNGGFNTLSNEMPSATPYEVANDIKAMHLTPNQVEQWLSSYTDEFSQEVRKYL